MTKCLFFILTLLHVSSLWAAEGQILKCLGAEEKRFHLKKQVGPVYDLNQKLIAEMVQIPRVDVVEAAYLKICAGEKFSESWKLLELSIKLGEDLFVIPKEVTGMQRSMTEGMISDYVEASKDIFLNFITQIQVISPTPTCLKEEIPELNEFFMEIKYLQEDVDMKDIFKGKDERIFDKLKNYPIAYEKCRAALKKKVKSKSKEARKKS